MFTHTVLSREVLEQDGCNLKLSGGALKPPRPANLCSAALRSARPWCVFFFSLSCSPLISWAYWVMIAHQRPVTEDVSWLSGIQEAPAESTVYAQKTAHSDTHTSTASQSLWYVYIEEKSYKKYGYKNRQRGICYFLWTSWKQTWGKLYAMNDIRSRWKILAEDTPLPGRTYPQQTGPYISVTHCRS